MTEKDRGQLLRMAGNIAAGIVTAMPNYRTDQIARDAADIALATMAEIDKRLLSQQGNSNGNPAAN